MTFRLKALALHLVVSCAVLSLTLGTLYVCWYRWPGWYLADAGQVTGVLAVVDLVLAASYVNDGVEIVIPGAANELSEHVRSLSMPNTVLVTGNGTSVLLEDREEGVAYVCRRGVCQLPAHDVKTLDDQLAEVAL